MSQALLQEVRNRFFTSAPPIPRAEVPGYDGLEVVGLSQGARARLMKKCATIVTNADGETEQVLDQALMQTTLLLECVVLKGSSTKLFSETDIEALEEQPSSYLEPLILKASALSALKADSLKVAEGNSEQTAG